MKSTFAQRAGTSEERKVLTQEWHTGMDESLQCNLRSRGKS
jgi:hypothetical protein